METTTTNPTSASKEGKAGFIPIPNLDKMSVGHAGLYHSDENNDTEIDVETISADIPLGMKGERTSTLLSLEGGIKDFVKDELAKSENHLPNTETGVWVHYLTEGIMRDFNRTWTETPTCLREKASGIEKSREKGKRVLSKKDKNELLAKLTYQYYEKDVNEGKITQTDAFASMAEAAAKKKELEDAGYFLSPKKTEGVGLFDWKSEVLNEWEGDESKLKIYTRNSVIPLVPCLLGKNSKIALQGSNKFVKKEIDKSIIAGIGVTSDANWMEERIEGWKKMKEHYTPKIFHIAKIQQSGKMKDRWLVVDAIRNKDGKQVLLMWDQNGVDGLLE